MIFDSLSYVRVRQNLADLCMQGFCICGVGLLLATMAHVPDTLHFGIQRIRSIVYRLVSVSFCCFASDLPHPETDLGNRRCTLAETREYEKQQILKHLSLFTLNPATLTGNPVLIVRIPRHPKELNKFRTPHEKPSAMTCKESADYAALSAWYDAALLGGAGDLP